MDNKKLIQELNDLLASKGFKKSEVEEKIGLPLNSLSNFLSGKKELPNKWHNPIRSYIDCFKEEYKVTEARSKLVVENTGKMKEKPSDEKIKRLHEVMDKINKDFGNGSVMIMGEKINNGIEVIPSGSLSLNNAMGVGGFPKGGIIEIYGWESSGKTTIALHAIAESQKLGGKCAFIDAEHALDSIYAGNLEVDIDKLIISQPSCGEEALEIADRLICSGGFSVVVIDSVAALVPKAELEGAMGDSKMGLQARLMGQAMRKMTSSISKTNTLVIFLNQLRMKIGVPPGMNPETSPGGNALKFYATIRLEIRRMAQLKDGDEIYGNRTKVKVVKNKVAPPFKVAEFDILYGEGIDKLGEVVDIAVGLGVIQQSGSWFSYNDAKLGQGKDTVRKMLQDNPEVAKEIENLILEKFKT